jgi:WD40 repeat protein
MLSAMQFSAASADGEDQSKFADTRGLNAPTLQSSFAYPVNTVRTLKFVETKDDLFLLAAGDDRVAHWWKVAGGKRQPDNLVLLHTLRWPVARGRGQIQALDAVPLPSGEVRIAFGGNGVYPSSVVLIDSKNVTATRTLEPQDLKARYQQTLAVQFHPKRPDILAVGYGGRAAGSEKGFETSSAKIILWQINDTGEKRLLTMDTGISNADAVAFSDDGERFAACDFDSGSVKEWRLTLDSRSTAKSTETIETHTQLHGLIFCKHDGWQVATQTHGLIAPARINKDHFEVRNLTGKNLELLNAASSPAKFVKELLPDGRASLPASARVFARSGDSASAVLPLSNLTGVVHKLDVRLVNGKLKYGLPGIASTTEVSRNGRWSITGRQGYFFDGVAQRPEAVLRNHVTGTAATLEIPGIEDAIKAAAITADGRIAAVATRRSSGESANTSSPVSICLFDLTTQKLLVSIPEGSLSTHRINCIRLGTSEKDARNVETIGIGLDGQLGNVVTSVNQTVDSAQHLLLDLDSIDLGQVGQLKTQSIAPAQVWLREVDGNYWSLTAQKTTGKSDARQSKIKLPIQPGLDSPTAALEFGPPQASRVAVGYGNGAVEVRDSATGQLLRKFYNHDGAVLALSVSEDQQWLASGGEDGVLRGWSLRGVLPAEKNESIIRHENELGLEFGIDATTPTVSSVRPGWPGDFAGLKEGHQITGLIRVQPDGTEQRTPLDAIRKKLLTPIPGQQLLITARFENQRSVLYTSTQFEPLFELWPLSDGHWFMSTPQNLFTASSRDTMRRFGWNVNLGREGVSAVRFFPVETFASDFENRFRIHRAIKKRKPIQISQQISYPSSVVISSIRRAGDDQSVVASMDQPFDLTVEIAATPNGPEEIEQVTLWCNGRRIEVPRAEIAKIGKAGVKVQARDLRAGTANLLVASVTSRIHDRILVGRDVRTIVVGDHPRADSNNPERPRVHFLGVGVTRLDATHNVPPLKFTANDAWHFGAELHRRVKASKRFEPGYFGWALTRSDVQGDFDQSITVDGINEPTRNGILTGLERLRTHARAKDLVCVLLAGHGFSTRWKANKDEDGFFFVAKDTAPDLHNSITGSEMFDSLNELACPVLLLIDACKSGGISNVGIKAPGQLSLGPEIITSSQSGELSYESDRIRLSGNRWIGHGLFSAAAIEAISGKQIQISSSGTHSMASTPKTLLDSDGNESIDVSELAVYLKSRIPEMQLKLDMLSVPGVKPQNPEILPSITFTSNHIQFPLGSP